LADGRAFYVMKLVKGRRLDALMADRPPLGERLTLFTRILDAVAFAHAHDIVHRDLKPENVMVGAFGEVYVMDWGVAQDGAADAEAAVVGTPGFMAPEQALARGVDPRADIYALGMLLGHLAGDDAPAPVRAIANRARNEAATGRYQRVEDFAADLARFRNDDPIEAYRESAVERMVRVYRRYEVPILLIVAYIVMRFALLYARGI
jgi:serine/threonine protein kinase